MPPEFFTHSLILEKYGWRAKIPTRNDGNRNSNHEMCRLHLLTNAPCAHERTWAWKKRIQLESGAVIALGLWPADHRGPHNEPHLNIYTAPVMLIELGHTLSGASHALQMMPWFAHHHHHHHQLFMQEPGLQYAFQPLSGTASVLQYIWKRNQCSLMVLNMKTITAKTHNNHV